jgi:transposase-like protein
MSESSVASRSDAAVATATRKRRWTATKKARVVAYYTAHGHGATIRRFKISSGQLHAWRQEQGSGTKRKQLNGHSGGGVDMATLVQARRVRKLMASRIVAAGGDVGPLELAVLSLVQSIMGDNK